jgi:hypothetical protein
VRASLRRKAAGYATLRQIVEGLRAIGRGDAIARGLIRLERYIRGFAGRQLAQHIKTGTARRTFTISTSRKRIDIGLVSYRRYIPGFSFAKGIPLAVLKRGAKILGEEQVTALRGQSSGGGSE